MANPVCTAATLAETNPVFGLQGLNKKQYQAATLYFMVLELAAMGGTNYTSVINSTLISDATALVKTMDPNQRRIALLNIARNRAIAAGASVPATANALNALTACCFQGFSDLEAIEILLLCKLGVHKAYTQ